ncbi:hypothetical protein K474DRAFT_1677548 [Panus rudis PR-1116 ss-1]|nr:hypothetical protein K474DRAFT_1677548 [Panus rudis PR-1116 ss-1]
MSSSDIQQKLQDAIDNAQKNPLPDEDQKAGMDALTSKVNEPESNQQLLDEIKLLAQYSLEIEQAFDDINSIFRKIQLENTSPGLKEDVQYLSDTWTTHHDTYINLLWESRRVAGAGQGAADDFAVDFAKYLGDENVTLAEKKAEISAYISKLDADEANAANMSQGFSTLQKNVQLFQQDWEKIAAKYDLDDMNAQAQQIQEDIKALTVQLNQLASKIETLAKVMYGLTAIAAVSLGLGLISPAYWIGTLVAVLGIFADRALMLEAQSQYAQTEEEVNKKKEQFATLMADIAAVQELKAGLQDSARNFDVIIARLGVFASVWAMLRSDIQDISEKLEYANSSVTWALMHSRLNTASALYAALGQALRQYQISVNPDNKIFVSRNLS